MKNADIVNRLRGILHDLNEDLTSEDICNDVAELIRELDSPKYPAPVENIEIRPAKDLFNYAIERVFEIVKWDNTHTSCYSLGTVSWNSHEEWFEFKSVGTRWLEAAPSKRVCNMIVNFCNEMTTRYKEND